MAEFPKRIYCEEWMDFNDPHQNKNKILPLPSATLQCVYLSGVLCIHDVPEHSPISMAFFLVHSTSPRTICRITRVKSRLPRKVAQKLRRQAPQLLRLCTCDLNYTSSYPTNSSQGIGFGKNIINYTEIIQQVYK